MSDLSLGMVLSLVGACEAAVQARLARLTPVQKAIYGVALGEQLREMCARELLDELERRAQDDGAQ